jgi:hypothetical protein
MLHDKYARTLGWRVCLHPTVAVELPAAGAAAAVAAGLSGGDVRTVREAAFQYVDNLCDRLEAELERAAADLFAACLEGGSHGTLLALRYTVTSRPRSLPLVSRSGSQARLVAPSLSPLAPSRFWPHPPPSLSLPPSLSPSRLSRSRSLGCTARGLCLSPSLSHR